MPSLNIYNHAEVVDTAGVKHVFGATGPAKQITVSGFVEDKTFQIGTSTTVKVFDIDESPLADFDYLAIEVDRNAMVEFVTDDDADVGEEVFTIGLLGSGAAGIPGPPLQICRDDSYANYSVAFAGGTLDVIETIRIKNLSGDDTVQAHVFIVT